MNRLRIDCHVKRLRMVVAHTTILLLAWQPMAPAEECSGVAFHVSRMLSASSPLDVRVPDGHGDSRDVAENLEPPSAAAVPDPRAPQPRPATEYLIAGGDFPHLPPDPNDHDASESLPLLDDELWLHGGAYLYAPEGDRRDERGACTDQHDERLRLPEAWQAPEPVTAFTDFLGTGPIRPSRKTWVGPGEYTWEPRFVAYGNYESLGFALGQAGQRQDVLGQNLLLDLDLRLTGTERFHVQFRPLGRRNTGGSYYQFSDPDGYVSNATGEPDRFWFEAEVHSLLGWFHDEFAQKYYNLTVGKFPLVLHNSLLINDDIVGGVLSQNNIVCGPSSNLNVQLFSGLNDVDTFRFIETQVVGIHTSIDYKRTYIETTYAYLNADADRDSHYVAGSYTKFLGPTSVAARGLFKFGDTGGLGAGQLVTLETNRTRVFERAPLGIHHGVFFCTAFWATDAWNSISGGNLNRLRTAFEVDPLVRLAAGPVQQGTTGVTLGVQLFRHHEDESWIPEIAWESPSGTSVWGAGLKYQKKLTARSFLDVLGVVNRSEDPVFDREGVFVSHRWIF